MNIKNMTTIFYLSAAILCNYSALARAEALNDAKLFLKSLTGEERKFINRELLKDKADFHEQLKQNIELADCRTEDDSCNVQYTAGSPYSLKELAVESKKNLSNAIKNTDAAQATLKGEETSDPYELEKRLEVIRLKSRPMFVICAGKPWIPEDKSKIFDYLASPSNLNNILSASKSIGELRLNHKQGDQWTLVKAGIATVVAIDTSHIITNAHVITELNIAYQVEGNWKINSKLLLDAKFPDEYQQCENRNSEKIIQVTGIKKLNEKLDFVILETTTHDIPGIEIPISISKLIDGDKIVVMGYPSEPDEDDTFLSGIEIEKLYSAPDGIEQIPALRLSPGAIMQKDKNETLLFRHDATTWGASSGSLVMRLRDGAFIGLHQGGMKSKTEGFGFNYAIPTTEIALAIK